MQTGACEEAPQPGRNAPLLLLCRCACGSVPCCCEEIHGARSRVRCHQFPRLSSNLKEVRAFLLRVTDDKKEVAQTRDGSGGRDKRHDGLHASRRGRCAGWLLRSPVCSGRRLGEPDIRPQAHRRGKTDCRALTPKRAREAAREASRCLASRKGKGCLREGRQEESSEEASAPDRACHLFGGALGHRACPLCRTDSGASTERSGCGAAHADSSPRRARTGGASDVAA
jgi:hypothetical protein